MWTPACSFENFFSKYSKGKDGVTLGDVADALKGQRVIMDPIGWFAAWFECKLPAATGTCSYVYLILTAHATLRACDVHHAVA